MNPSLVVAGARGIPRDMPMALLALPLVVTLLVAGVAPVAAAPEKNGFDLANARVPVAEIIPGGPPRDGIPAVDSPVFVAADGPHLLRDGDRVLGLTGGSVAKAYPIGILNWHEIVNDTLDGQPVVVSYCPLCGTGMVFAAPPETATKGFGVSGLLYNSDLLLYDRQTHSLWSQVWGRAITGPRAGTVLAPLPVTHTTWGVWRERHPQTVVMSRDTGHGRDYDRDPYMGYANTRKTLFPVSGTVPDAHRWLHPKAWVVGVLGGDKPRAYPFSELKKVGGELVETRAGKTIRLSLDPGGDGVRVTDAHGTTPVVVRAYWFAWVAFHPDTEVFRAP